MYCKTTFFSLFLALAAVLFSLPCLAAGGITITHPNNERASCATDTQASIWVQGKISAEALKAIDKQKAKVYVFVRNLDKKEGLYYPQNPVKAERSWGLHAFLGSMGEDVARHGQKFEITAVLSSSPPAEVKIKRSRIAKNLGVISKPVVVRVDRLGVDLQSYGDYAYRKSNFSSDDYKSIVGWWENRVVLRYKRMPKEKWLQTLLFEPYVKATLATSEKSYPWENTLRYGAGLENRFLEGIPALNISWFNWLTRLRLYVEYLMQSYIKDEADNSVPEHDLRFGLDIWKEWNVLPDYPNSCLWGELWGNASYRSTNFSSSDYEAFVGGLMSRFGLKFPKPWQNDGWSLNLMPYLKLEASYTGKDYFWENRLDLGGGIRFMPVYRWGEGSKKEIIFRIYAEWLHTADHFRGDPDPDTPENDFRVGINFSYNLF